MGTLRRLTTGIALSVVVTVTGCSTTGGSRYDAMDAQEMYKVAQKEMKRGRYFKATETLEALEARYPFGDYADKAQLTSIYAYYMNDEFSTAASESERFIQLHPRHQHVSYAYYMKALSHFQESMEGFNRYLPVSRALHDMSSSKQAYFDFMNFLQRYPSSPYAADAYQRIVYLRNNLAEHEILNANFYLEKGAYLAAANRAHRVIIEFDQTPWLPDALAIMVKAYRELGMNRLADDTLLIAESNYPRSPLIKALR